MVAGGGNEPPGVIRKEKGSKGEGKKRGKGHSLERNQIEEWFEKRVGGEGGKGASIKSKETWVALGADASEKRQR